MFKETQSMKELHKIREDLYNETRYRSPAERISYLNKEADKVRVFLKGPKENVAKKVVKEKSNKLTYV